MMELDFIPTPYPDEPLSGIVSRYHDRSGNISAKQTNMELFNTEQMCVGISDVYNINVLCNKLSENTLLTPDRIIRKHTMLPIYVPFIAEINKQFRIYSMCEQVKKVPVTHLKTDSYAGRNRYLMHCPECLVADEKKYGESYWHRSHQVSGVDVCHRHGEWLIQSNVSCLLENLKCEYVLPSQTVFRRQDDNRKFGSKKLNKFMADSIYWLLTYNINDTSLNETSLKYYSKIKQHNYTDYHGISNDDQLVKDITEFCLSNGIAAVPLHKNKHGNNIWLDHLLNGNSTLNNVINHLLFVDFLGMSCGELVLSESPMSNPFGSGPWPCLNPLSSHFKDHVITEYENVYNCNRLVGAIFKCSCGFIYRKSRPYKCDDDNYDIAAVVEYGEVWDKEMRRMKYDESKKFKEIYKNMDISKKFTRYSFNTINMK